ncbi:MAG: MATE family efflux transporter [Bacillota bacterium]|nr:MATE family efflux transporter [Bacillota bacterium]
MVGLPDDNAVNDVKKVPLEPEFPCPPTAATAAAPSASPKRRRLPDLTSMDLRASVLFLAVPAVMRNLLQTVIQMVSLMIVGSLGSSAVASVGVANRIFFVIIGVLSALSVGATALVARHIGAGDREGAERVVGQAVLFSILVGVTMAILGATLATPAMRWMMQMQEEMDMEVVRQGADYIRVVCLSMSVGVLLFMGNAVLQGAGDMKTPLYVMSGVNLVNLLIAWLLVQGIGPFPALGVLGAGYAAAIARALGGVVSFAILAHPRAAIGFKLRSLFRPDYAVLGGILHIGIPAAMEQLIHQGSQIIYTVFIAGMGTASIAANSIAMSIQSLSFMPGMGFGLAATALVGQCLGAGKPKRAEEAGYESLRMGMVAAGLAAALFLFLPVPLARMYSAERDVVALTASCLRISAVAQPSLAIIQVLAGGLRGAGDTRWVMYVAAAGNWGVRLVGSWILGVHLGWGLVGVWVAMALDQLLRGGLTWYRYRSGHWKTVKAGIGRRSRVGVQHGG